MVHPALCAPAGFGFYRHGQRTADRGHPRRPEKPERLPLRGPSGDLHRAGADRTAERDPAMPAEEDPCVGSKPLCKAAPRRIRKNKKSNICLNSIDKVCNNCGLKTFCFDTKNSDTLESFLQINEILRSNGKVNKESFPENFAKRCNRKSELANNINALYREAIEKEVSDRRISEVREFVSEQFADMGTLLSEMGKEIRNYKTFDLELAKKITVELKKLKLMN